MSPFKTDSCHELITVIESECVDVEQHAEDCVGECKDLVEKAVRCPPPPPHPPADTNAELLRRPNKST
jgi:hypothetical protein